jgi:hypothetical protein
LVIRELPEETLVYDLQRHEAFCLNHTAARVWKLCDGKTAPEDIARRLGDGIDQRLVWMALAQLSRYRLLEKRAVLPESMASMTRRRQLATLGKAAAIAVPAISAVVAPQAAEASTCLHAGASCVSSAQCCSQLCGASGQCVGG